MLSVIIPVFNTREYLERCIDSVLAQTLKEIEIVIVDDGSTDGSEQIVDKYAKNDSRIHVIHKVNEGLIAARLTGVQNARGELVGFVDSDDYVDSQMYERLTDYMEASGADVVSSGIMREYETGEVELAVDHFAPGLYKNLETDIFPSMIFNYEMQDFGIYCNLVNKVFKRAIMNEVLEQIDKRITYGEDAAVFYSYMVKCKSVFITDALYYHYCIRRDSMCMTKGEALAESTFRLYSSLLTSFEGGTMRDVLIRQLKQYVLRIERYRLTHIYNIHPALLNSWEFDYPDGVLDEDYVLYGAGGCGQAFYQHIERIGKQENMVAWVDINYMDVQVQCNYPVVSIENGLARLFKTVVIAVKDDELKEQITMELTSKYNVKKNEVVCIDAREFTPF